MKEQKLFPNFYIGLSIQLATGVLLVVAASHIDNIWIFAPLAFLGLFLMLTAGPFYEKAGFD